MENPKGRIWTDVFADEMVHLGERRPDVVAITAAMMHPVGLHHFQARFPDRTFDVGIAEQHAATRPPAWRWAACTRSSRSTRRSSTGPSTRC